MNTMTNSQTPNEHDRSLMLKQELEEFLTITFGPPELVPPWPPSLSPGPKYARYEKIDEWKTVVPSWNSAPKREVVRDGCTVAVINIPESADVTVVDWEESSTEHEAQQRFQEIYRRECAGADAIFQDVPDELQRGALRSDNEEVYDAEHEE